MIQYKITYTSSAVPPECGAGNLSIHLTDGVPQRNGNDIRQIFVYYDANEMAQFVLECDDGPVDDHVRFGMVDAAPADDRTWASSGGCRWQRSNGNLVFEFTPPEVGRTGASVTWQFEPSTPPVHLTIKIKRQGASNTGACSGWPE